MMAVAFLYVEAEAAASVATMVPENNVNEAEAAASFALQNM